MVNYQEMEQTALRIYRAAYDAEQAGFDGCSRHANCLLMMAGWAETDGGWFARERAAYLAGMIISGEYRK
jgi:hypothetical protein